MAKSKSYKKKLPKYFNGGPNDPIKSRFKLVRPENLKSNQVIFDINPFTEKARQRDYVNLEEVSVSPKYTAYDALTPEQKALLKAEEEKRKQYPNEVNQAEDQPWAGRIIDAAANTMAGLTNLKRYGTLPSYFSDDWLQEKGLSPITMVDAGLQMFTRAGDVAGLVKGAKDLPGHLAEGNYLAAGFDVLPLAGPAFKATKNVINTHPAAWFKSAEQRLATPELYKTLQGETSWKDPIGKIQNAILNKKLSKYSVISDKNRKLAEALENNEITNEDFVKEISKLKNKEKKLQLDLVNLNAKRSGLPLKPVITESGTPLGGGHGRIYYNTLNPGENINEVVKVGMYPGSEGNLIKLVEAGKKLKPFLPNVAFPSEYVNIGKSDWGIDAAQKMPWLGGKINPKTGVFQELRYDVPSLQQEQNLIDEVELLDKFNVGIDYKGAGNIQFNPNTNRFNIYDLNYTDPKSWMSTFNRTDVPVKQRLKDKKYISSEAFEKKANGGYIYNNMAGKLNKRKGLPSRFPMYVDGSTVGAGLLSGANAGLDAGTSSSMGNNINYLKLINPAMNLLSAFKQPIPEEYMGTNAYFDKQNQLTGQNAALTNAVSRGLSFIPGWGQAASLGLQAGKVAGDLIGQKDQYGVAGSGAQQIASGILDPIGSINSMAQGQNPFSRKQKMGQVSNLYKDFSSDKTAQEQDAYTQSMKAQEGAYLEYGGLMHFASGGRMVNPYNGMPNAEIEGEVVNHANGGIQDFSHLPNHEQATSANEVNLEPGTFIFSKRIKNPVTGRPFATDAKRYTTTKEEKILNDKNVLPITTKSAKLMFGVKKQLAENLAELHEATKLHNGAQKAENEATEEFIGMLGGMYGKGGLIKRKDGSYSPRGLWDNIRANRGSGKKPTKAMLEQERKIKAKYPDGGKVNTLEGDLISKVVMNRNKDKDFVKRAYAVGAYPDSKMFTIPDQDSFMDRMSHKMAWGEDDNGQAYMFPTVLNPNNEAIKVPNQYADYISSIGYKKEAGIPYKEEYESGGYALGESYDMTDEEIKELKKQGYTFDIE